MEVPSIKFIIWLLSTLFFTRSIFLRLISEPATNAGSKAEEPLGYWSQREVEATLKKLASPEGVISYRELALQLRVMCGQELVTPGKGLDVVSDDLAGGPPLGNAPTTKTCQMFANMLPSAARAIMRGRSNFELKLAAATKMRFDERLASLMRYDVDYAAMQKIILKFAHWAWPDGAGVPRSLLSLLVSHLISGPDAAHWEKQLGKSRTKMLSESAELFSEEAQERAEQIAEQDRMAKLELIQAAVRGETTSGDVVIHQTELDAACAVACQATLSEHAWYEPPDEQIRADFLATRLTSGKSPSPGNWSARVHLATLGSYRPLLPVVKKWSTLQEWRDAYRNEKDDVQPNWQFWQLWRLAVEEPMVEAEIKEEILANASSQSNGTTNNTEDDTSDASMISDAVRAMYESHPYPKWDQLPEVKDKNLPPSLTDWLKGKNWKPPIGWPSESWHKPKVLSAGCGTGFHLLNLAQAFKETNVSAGAEIWGMDLSATALAHAARRAREHNITNVRFIQGDVRNPPDAIRKEAPFDYIEVGGVLHHLADPIEGWTQLNELLRPGGVMFVSLYSKLARSKHVDACRTFGEENGYDGSNIDSLRQFRRDLMREADDGTSWARRVVEDQDFSYLSGIRTFCLHVIESQFSMLEIADMLKQVKMKWLRLGELSPRALQFKFSDHYGFNFTDKNAKPEVWDEFEERYTYAFAGMYKFFVQNCRNHTCEEVGLLGGSYATPQLADDDDEEDVEEQKTGDWTVFASQSDFDDETANKSDGETEVNLDQQEAASETKNQTESRRAPEQQKSAERPAPDKKAPPVDKGQKTLPTPTADGSNSDTSTAVMLIGPEEPKKVIYEEELKKMPIIPKVAPISDAEACTHEPALAGHTEMYRQIVGLPKYVPPMPNTITPVKGFEHLVASSREWLAQQPEEMEKAKQMIVTGPDGQVSLKKNEIIDWFMNNPRAPKMWQKNYTGYDNLIEVGANYDWAQEFENLDRLVGTPMKLPSYEEIATGELEDYKKELEADMLKRYELFKADPERYERESELEYLAAKGYLEKLALNREKRIRKLSGHQWEHCKDDPESCEPDPTPREIEEARKKAEKEAADRKKELGEPANSMGDPARGPELKSLNPKPEELGPGESASPEQLQGSEGSSDEAPARELPSSDEAPAPERSSSQEL
eukprot:gnl/TRDRNA2_/TRDRNA2_178024_c4_seq3.p1 gnl/TRDRNA2_/TRDRNA2_178024_c4~~gnl/TRDRNA2_/TRDRNA2_178024_c4_seq3.p1  ORF type:complete len:1169 (-),score=271.28 gnl/TRDRNA2_/TRDRNA2_178024_c4_seq3:357-3863(-)